MSEGGNASPGNAGAVFHHRNNIGSYAQTRLAESTGLLHEGSLRSKNCRRETNQEESLASFATL